MFQIFSILYIFFFQYLNFYPSFNALVLYYGYNYLCFLLYYRIIEMATIIANITKHVNCIQSCAQFVKRSMDKPGKTKELAQVCTSLAKLKKIKYFLNFFSATCHGTERIFLDAKLEAEALGYWMKLKSSRESERLQGYSPEKLQL